MFNVTIRQVGIEEREEIIICCHEISDEIMSLANSIKGQKSFLLASKDGEMFKLDTKEIFYIESVDNKTFIYCKNQKRHRKILVPTKQKSLGHNNCLNKAEMNDNSYASLQFGGFFFKVKKQTRN